MGSLPSSNRLASLKAPDITNLISLIRSGSPDAITIIKQMPNYQELNISENQWNLLHLASWYGNYHLCKELIKLGINANLQDSNKETPLHLAAWRGHYKTVQALIEISEINKKNVVFNKQKGESPRDLALTNGHNNVVELIEKSLQNEVVVYDLN